MVQEMAASMVRAAIDHAIEASVRDEAPPPASEAPAASTDNDEAGGGLGLSEVERRWFYSLHLRLTGDFSAFDKGAQAHVLQALAELGGADVGRLSYSSIRGGSILITVLIAEPSDEMKAAAEEPSGEGAEKGVEASPPSASAVLERLLALDDETLEKALGYAILDLHGENPESGMMARLRVGRSTEATAAEAAETVAAEAAETVAAEAAEGAAAEAAAAAAAEEAAAATAAREAEETAAEAAAGAEEAARKAAEEETAAAAAAAADVETMLREMVSSWIALVLQRLGEAAAAGAEEAKMAEKAAAAEAEEAAAAEAAAAEAESSGRADAARSVAKLRVVAKAVSRLLAGKAARALLAAKEEQTKARAAAEAAAAEAAAAAAAAAEVAAAAAEVAAEAAAAAEGASRRPAATPPLSVERGCRH